ncbi:MAG: hypothetical protein HPY66_2945 [Firmicutes bacterium]|nr:hypothetical protein [Bacillota bacterium]
MKLTGKVLLTIIIMNLLLNCFPHNLAYGSQLDDAIWYILPIPSSTKTFRIDGGILTYRGGNSSVLTYRVRDNSSGYWYARNYTITRREDDNYGFAENYYESSRDYRYSNKFYYEPTDVTYVVLCRTTYEEGSDSYSIVLPESSGRLTSIITAYRHPDKYHKYNGFYAYNNGNSFMCVGHESDIRWISNEEFPPGYYSLTRQIIQFQNNSSGVITLNPGQFYDGIYANGRHIVVGIEREELISTGPNYNVTYTSDNGTSWIKHLSSHRISALYTINGNLIGRNGRNIYIAKDALGTEWELKLTTATDIADYFYYDNKLWFITADWRFYSSTDGILWIERRLSIPGGYVLRSAAFDDYNLVVATTEERTVGVIPGSWLFNANAIPAISIIQPANGSEFDYNGTITVSGQVRDENAGDILTIRYTINGAPSHNNKVLTTITANGNNQNFTATIQLSGTIPEQATSMTIWVTDNQGGTSNTITINNIRFNHPPSIQSINIDKTSLINDQEININGSIRDVSQGRQINLYYTVSGISEHTNKKATLINPAVLISNGGNLNFQAKIPLDSNIPSGKYVLKIWADNGRMSSEIYKTDIEVRSILNIINQLTSSYIPTYKNEDIRCVVINTDNNITGSNENNNMISNISNLIKDLDSNLFFIGRDGSTRAYIENNLTNMFKMNTVNYVLPTQVNSHYLLDYILEKHREFEPIETSLYVTGDYLKNSLGFTDIEKDYSDITISDKLKGNQVLANTLKTPKQGSMQIRYTHDPSVFDNPAATHEKSNGLWRVIENINDEYVLDRASPELRGEWIMEVKASDTTGDARYDKYSDVEMYLFIVHEKPKAVVESAVRENGIILSGRNSYDIDYQYSKPNNGIQEYLWRYQLENGDWYDWSTSVNTIIPKTMGGQEVVNYSLTVWDYHGASDTVVEALIPSEELQLQLLAKLNPEVSSFSLTSIPSTEALKVTDIITVSPDEVDRIEFALYSNDTRRTGLVQLNSPSDILETDGIETAWKDIRDYVITPRDINNSYLRDGSYTAILKAASDKATAEKEWEIRIETPIELAPDMPGEIAAGNAATLKAETSKYVETITITLLGDIITLNDNNNIVVGNKKVWEYEYTPPNNLPDGYYTAVFTAKTYNGETQIVEKEFRLQNLMLKDFAITDMVNHPWHTFPIAKDDLPVDYKTGYYVTFRIDSLGNPDAVRAEIRINGSLDKTVDMVPVGSSGPYQIWQGRYYAGARTAVGSVITFILTADKGESTYDYNTREGWDGRALTVTGTALEDARVNRIY